jgi:hypothetical protein
MFQVHRWLRRAGLALCGLAMITSFSVQSVSAINLFGDVCKGAGSGSAACSGNGKDTISGSNGVILRAANLLSIIAGVAAVIMIMIGGFMMITGAGDSSRIGTGRKTIIYAIVGIIVIVLARTIVAFVVTRV